MNSAFRLSDPLQDHLADLRVDAQWFGDPEGDAGVAVGRLLHEGWDICGDVAPWPEEIRVYDDLLSSIGHAGVKPLLNGRLPQLHMGVVDDAQAKAILHHLSNLFEEIVRFLAAAAVIDDEEGSRHRHTSHAAAGARIRRIASSR